MFSLTRNNLEEQLESSVLDTSESSAIRGRQVVEVRVAAERSLTRQERTIVELRLL